MADELDLIASAARDLHAILSTRQTAADVTAGYATMLRRVAHHLMFYQARLRQKSEMICVEEGERQQLQAATESVLNRVTKDLSQHAASAKRLRVNRVQQFGELTSYLCRQLPQVMRINPKPVLRLARIDGQNIFSESTADPVEHVERSPPTDEEIRVANTVARALRFLGKVEVEATSRSLMAGSKTVAALVDRPPLRGSARVAAMFIVRSPEPVPGKIIAREIGMENGSFFTHIAPVLKKYWGLENNRSDGYYFPPDAPIHPELYSGDIP